MLIFFPFQLISKIIFCQGVGMNKKIQKKFPENVLEKIVLPFKNIVEREHKIISKDGYNNKQYIFIDLLCLLFRFISFSFCIAFLIMCLITDGIKII
jgi:hypothetical protein